VVPLVSRAGRSARSRRLLASQLDLRFESRRLAVVRLEGGAQAIESRGIEISSAFLGAINGVAERLRGLVGELSIAEGFESCLAVVEGILRGLSGAVELLFQSIE